MSETGWAKKKPTKPGVYGVRGFNICKPPSKQVEAIVRVSKFGGKLVCNLHECNADEPSDSWSWLADLSDRFEWREYVVKGAAA